MPSTPTMSSAWGIRASWEDCRKNILRDKYVFQGFSKVSLHRKSICDFQDGIKITCQSLLWLWRWHHWKVQIPSIRTILYNILKVFLDRILHIIQVWESIYIYIILRPWITQFYKTDYVIACQGSKILDLIGKLHICGEVTLTVYHH